MTTQTKARPASPTARPFSRRVKSAKRMRNGRRINLGYDNDAYLADTVCDTPIEPGSVLTGTYRVETRNGQSFARVLSVSGVGTPAAERTAPARRATMRAHVPIKNVQQAGSGYIMWSRAPSHRLPTFVPFHRLDGINIFTVAEADIEFYRNSEGKLIVSDFRVKKSK